MSFLGVRFEVGGNLVKIMQEIWSLVRKYTYVCSFREYTF